MADSNAGVLLVEDHPDDAGFTVRALRKATPALNIVRVDESVKAFIYLFDETAQPATLESPALCCSI